MEHTLAVNSVLLAAQRLSQTVLGIRLTRLLTERELQRKLYVDVPPKICLEPDAGVRFLMTDIWYDPPRIFEDCFFIEVYRNLPPAEWRFKQKIKGYVTYALTRQNEAFFGTSALSVAVFAASQQMAITLKHWTEEALQEMGRPAEGEWFFFCNVDVAAVSPEALFLSPRWETAFGTDQSPLIVLGEATT
jgi:hypothetical protein